MGKHKENSVFNIIVFKQEQVTEDIPQPVQPQQNQQITPPVESNVQDKIQWKLHSLIIMPEESQLVWFYLISYLDHFIFLSNLFTSNIFPSDSTNTILQSLPKDIVDVLKVWKLHSLILFFNNNNKNGIHCKLNIHYTHRKTVKIAKGWKEFCTTNNILKNITLWFDFKRANNNRVYVTKV